jgi:hypothetical protein
MRRKAHNRLWTLILMMLLCGASFAPTTRVARADSTPADPVPGIPGGDPGAGDPDAPDNGRNLPRPGSTRGATGQTIRVTSPQSPMSMWMMSLRVAFASVYRFLFRF